jgi:hypothetical protein
MRASFVCLCGRYASSLVDFVVTYIHTYRTNIHVQYSHMPTVGTPGKDTKPEFLKNLDESTLSEVQALHVQVHEA